MIQGADRPEGRRWLFPALGIPVESLIVPASKQYLTEPRPVVPLGASAPTRAPSQVLLIDLQILRTHAGAKVGTLPVFRTVVSRSCNTRVRS
jgi:hypothetical protein